MAESATAANQPWHTRSISLPSRSPPAALRVEEELRKLRSSMASPSSTPEKMCDGLRRLEGVYESINQQIVTQPLQRRWVEEERDGSIRLLDVCSALKDCSTAMREHVRGLQLALRKNDEAAIVSKVSDYARFGRKAEKEMRNRFRSLKRTEDRRIDEHDDLPTAIRVLMEAKVITVALLRLASSFLSMQTRRPRSSRWSFVSKALSKRKVASEEEGHEGVGSLDCIWCKDVDGERAGRAQSRRQLQRLDVSMEGFESALECLFRQLIQTRVSLLNMLSS
ncbi:hypothetical protein OPV22_012253 [Ensete ventricosum]|uniref:Syntaxin N-terminal domain-containing protein n=1 Tax=Ensete ventricosum TaxID=4639 RepID=A0AAV8R2P3_ENSVE|nr:hypothetical protein OPV22_012253 [Ensete ventricosum]RWW29805.1 hypothetical protein GW17_00005669 [Ensete ventricosum]RZR91790.1 hypothetical protein BHM03_00019977 [Ensete ventricosum]